MITMNLHHHVPASLGSYGQPVPDTGNCLLPVWKHQPANVRESGTDISSANKSSDDWTPHSHVKVSGNHRTSTYLIGCTAEVRSCAKTGGWVTLVCLSNNYVEGTEHCPLQCRTKH